jgi:hypothetical protein
MSLEYHRISISIKLQYIVISHVKKADASLSSDIIQTRDASLTPPLNSVR